ncbi:MAG TPA: hypothetical protein DD435_05910 [Cyanobacteria bacterium UBA8530]|nr:hypothetical protein [Cyanobacteria bacterium UBA8530]
MIATAVGLLVAIPAVIAYNFLQRLIKISTSRMENAGRQLLSALENSGKNEKSHEVR